tara:strand:+ start:976 stop:1719 length:744 start_codon:yes stop_codon:yes gene_type:complete
MKFENKSVIVTGGASGIGKVISEFLLKKKLRVAILDINEEALGNLKNNKNLFKIKCDLTKETEISKAIKAIKDKFKKIDILINNAGILFSEPLINITSKNKRHSLDSWRKVIDINLSAPFVISSYVVEQMVINRTKGLIINISSISAKGNAGQSAYSAAKAGIDSLTSVWAKELGSFGIRCVSIAPGYINTNSTHSAINKTLVTSLKKEIPLKRLGNAQDVANTIKFVIENDYINGKIIPVDGGLVI